MLTWRPAKKREAIAGPVLGLWFGGWFALYHWLVTSDYVVGEAFPAEYRHNPLAERLDISPTLLLLVALLAPPLLVLAWSSLERVLTLDSREIAPRSLAWGLRNGTIPTIAIVALVLVLSTFPSPSHPNWLALWPFAIVDLAPLSFIRKEVASSSRARRWWWPTWPGIKPLLSLSALMATVWLAGRLGNSVPATLGWAGQIPGWFIALGIYVLNPLAAVAILIYRIEPRTLLKEIRARVRPCIGPFIALHPRLLILVLAFATPFLFLYYFSDQLGQIHFWYRESPTATPKLLSAFAPFGFWFRRYFVLSFAIFISHLHVLCSFVVCRLVWLAANEPEAEGPLAVRTASRPQATGEAKQRDVPPTPGIPARASVRRHPELLAWGQPAAARRVETRSRVGYSCFRSGRCITCHMVAPLLATSPAMHGSASLKSSGL
jgi:hypothetical protein